METEEKPRYINPMSDYGFKKIFGDEEIMMTFLNDLLEPESPIVDISFLNKEMSAETYEIRGIIYDIRCKTKNGTEFIVEMQNNFQSYFTDRVLSLLKQKRVKEIGDIN